MDKITVAAQMLAITSSIAGSKKRHDSILLTLNQSLHFKKDRASLAESLSRRLKKDEGVIFSTGMYGQFTGNIAVEGEMIAFQKELEKYDLSLCCIYHQAESSVLPSALFIIIHRDMDKAIGYKNEIHKVLGVSQQKPIADLVKTFIKITETLDNDNMDVGKLVTACQLLTGDEVYCVTMNVMLFYSVDPRQISAMLDTAGLHVCPLLKAIDSNIPEPYREFERLIGFLVSRTEVGIAWGQKNIEIIMKVCDSAEEGLLKPKKNVLMQ